MKFLRVLGILVSWTLAAVPGLAQSSTATGVITGRVFNPNTGEYVRNAEVRIEETGQSTTSENGGEFRLAPVPAGQVTLMIAYTGYRSVSASLNVAPGEIVTRDFNLVSALELPRPEGEVVKLGQFVVSSEREGNAKAIMEQRTSMTNLDAGGGWRLTNHLVLNVSARNVLNTAYITMAKVGSNPAVITNHEITGITYTFALKGTW